MGWVLSQIYYKPTKLNILIKDGKSFPLFSRNYFLKHYFYRYQLFYTKKNNFNYFITEKKESLIH